MQFGSGRLRQVRRSLCREVGILRAVRALNDLGWEGDWLLGRTIVFLVGRRGACMNDPSIASLVLPCRPRRRPIARRPPLSRPASYPLRWSPPADSAGA